MANTQTNDLMSTASFIRSQIDLNRIDGLERINEIADGEKLMLSTHHCRLIVGNGRAFMFNVELLRRGCEPQTMLVPSVELSDVLAEASTDLKLEAF